jgi:hypothetical protein
VHRNRPHRHDVRQPGRRSENTLNRGADVNDLPRVACGVPACRE